MAIPGFIARADIAVGAVRARFPQASVHRVEAAASTGPTTTPMALDRLRVLFRNVDGTVLVAEETGYGEFGPVRRLDSLRPEGPSLDWPVTMELAEADNLFAHADEIFALQRAGLGPVEIARRLGVRAGARLLLRIRDTPHQLELPPDRRAANVRGAFAVEPLRRREIEGRRIALVDDVLTTGATVEACSRVLERAGAECVDVLTLARVIRPAV